MPGRHDLTDHHRGPLGEARRLPPERLCPTLSGDTVATLDGWWMHLPGTPLLVVHTGEMPTSIAQAKGLEVLVPPAGGATLDTFSLWLITLADLPGVRPAQKQWPWVTHELLVYTIDTADGAGPFETPLPWPFMHPHNLGVQFEADDDDQARHLLHDLARAVVEGLLRPEVQAYVPQQNKMMTVLPLYQQWQDTVAATMEHLRTGGTHR